MVSRVAALCLAALALGAGVHEARAGGGGARARHAVRKLVEMPRPDRTLVVATTLRIAARATGRLEKAKVRLGDLRAAHGVPTAAIARKIERRARDIEPTIERAPPGAVLSQGLLQQVMPSKNPLRVIRHRGGYLVLDGNSRLRALRRAARGRADLFVEVDVIETRSRLVERLADVLLEMRGPAPSQPWHVHSRRLRGPLMP